MFFFAFETVAWKLFLSLRSLILKMWSLEFWCISRVDVWRLLQPVVVKAFLSPVDLQILQPCKFFQPSRQKMPLLLNRLTGLWFRIRLVFFFQPTFCPFCPRMPHNETLVPKPLQGVSKWFSKHQKSKLENHSKWVWPFLVLKQESGKRRRFKSLYVLFSKRIFWRSTQF